MSETKKKVITRFIATVLFFILAASIVFGQDTAKVVFGPKTYTRGAGKPETITDTFSVTNPAGQFTIYIQNGDSKQTRVSSGSLAINNVEVVGESEFNKQIEKIEKPLTGIQKNNAIQVTLKSKPGSFLIVKITGTNQYVQPTLIWQKEFSAEITDVSPTFPLKYVVTKDSIKFLDENGNLSVEIPLKYMPDDPIASSRVFTSKNGQYLIILTPIEIWADEEGAYETVTKYKNIFVNNNGNILWEREDIEPIFVSNSGEYLIDWKDFNLIFYNSAGNLIKKVSHDEINAEFMGGEGEFSNDGNYFIAHIQDTSNLNDPSYLYGYSKNGDEVWKCSLKGWGRAIKISPNDSYIVAAAATETADLLYLYNINGNLIWAQNIAVSFSEFSPDSNYLGILGGGMVYIFETQTGNLLWEYNTGMQLRNIAISESGDYVAVSGTTYVDKSKHINVDNDGSRYVYLFDKSGNKIWQKEYSREGYTSWEQAPRLLISEDGSTLVIAEKKGLSYYTLK